MVKRTEVKVAKLHNSISQPWKRHLKGLVGGPRQRHRTLRAKTKRDQCHRAIEALELIPTAAENQLVTNRNRTVIPPGLF